MKKIYFDNGSTAFPKAPGVAAAITEFLEGGSYNINRGGYEASYALSDTVLYTRERLCNLFGFHRPRNVIFTGSVTVSLNMVLKGLLRQGDHVVVSSMEHNAVMRPIVQLEKAGLITYSAAQSDGEGLVSPQAVAGAITPKTRAVVMLHASNVCGTVNDIAAIGAVCKEYGVFFICDAAQSAGVIPIHMGEMGISGLCFTGHKSLLGPQGIGGFILTPELEKQISPLLAGGTGSVSDSLDMPHTMPDKFEVGTLNLPGIIGLGAALSYLESKGIDTIRAHELDLTQCFLDGAKRLPFAKIVGKKDTAMRTAVVSLDFEGRDNAEVSYTLDAEYNIMTRCGMHCAPMAHKSLGTFPQGTVRFSFGYDSKQEDVAYCLEALEKICKG